MATEMAKVRNRVNFSSEAGRLICAEKSGQREYLMILGFVQNKGYGIQCPENIRPVSTCLELEKHYFHTTIRENFFSNRVVDDWNALNRT